jgi:hypothetical protein
VCVRGCLALVLVAACGRVNFQRLGAEGARDGGGGADSVMNACAESQLTNAGGDANSAKLVGTATGYAAIWIDSRSGAPQMFFASLDAQGNKRTAEIPLQSAISASVAYNGSDLALAWIDSLGTAFARIDETGQFTRAPVRLVGDITADEPVLLRGATTYALVQSIGTVNNRQVSTYTVDDAGALMGPSALSSSNGLVAGLSVAWSGTLFGIAFTDEKNNRWETMLARMDGSAVLSGNETQLTNATSPGLPGRTAIVADVLGGWGLAYEQELGTGSPVTRFARRDPTGTLIGSNLTFDASFAPSMVFQGGQYVIAFHDSVTTLNDEVAVAFVDENSVEVSRIDISNAPGRSNAPSLANGPGGLAVAWEDDRSGSREIYFALVCP